jgi:hypothetical protein
MKSVINGQSGPASAPALTTLQVLANSVDARAAYSGAAGSQMSYSWSVLSSVCGIAELSNSTSAQPSLVLGSAMGSLVVRSLVPSTRSLVRSLARALPSHMSMGIRQLSVCATDGEESTYVTARVQVGASEPVIQTQTEGPYLDVPLGYVNYPVSVTAGGVPAPTYQWQYLTLENVTLPDTNDTTDNTTTVMVRRNVAHDDDSFESEFVVRWLDNRALTEVAVLSLCEGGCMRACLRAPRPYHHCLSPGVEQHRRGRLESLSTERDDGEQQSVDPVSGDQHGRLDLQQHVRGADRCGPVAQRLSIAQLAHKVRSDVSRTATALRNSLSCTHAL